MTLSEEFRALAVQDGGRPFQLAELPADALGRVLELLSIQDIHNLIQASRGLHEALQNDAVWADLCVSRWGALTNVSAWLVPPLPPTMPGTPQQRATLPLPQTYRRLYMLLHETAPVVGLWRLVGEGPRSALISFRWARDGIEGEELEPRLPLTGRAAASPWARVCPARGLTTAVAVEPEGGHATVTVYGAQGQRLHRSPSAEAAAAVALPHSQASSSPLGCSPVGSFEAEWLEFMAGTVGKRPKQRRRAQRGMGMPARPEGPAVFHLKRVPSLTPTARHPHRGLWVGDFGPDAGMEVLALSYDFSGKAAMLVASKVTGDECVPSGQVSWRAKAAPIKVPLPPAESALVAEQEERWLQQWEWLLEAGDDSDASDGSSIAGGGSGSFSFAPPPAGPAEQPAPRRLPRSSSSGGGSATGEPGTTARRPAQQPPRVVAVHEGSGQVAGPGFRNPEWVEGRLLVFADGSLSFVWLEGLEQVTEMRRLRLRR